MSSAASASASTSAALRWVQWSTLAAPSSTASRTPGPGPSWLPCTRSPSPAARPASSTARASSSVKAWAECGSQNTSIQRAYGAAAAQHRAGDQVHVAGPVVPPLRRHDVGPEQRGLGGHLAGDPQQPGLVVDGEPVAALDLDRRGAGGPELGHPGRQPAAELVVARCPGGGHRGGDPAAVVGLPGHPGGELGRAVAGEHQVAVRIDEAGQHGAAVDVDLGRRRAVPSSRGPTQAIAALVDHHGRVASGSPAGRRRCRRR